MATESTPAVLGEGAPVAEGMPQLDPSSYTNQIFWLIVALAAIYFILARVALPRIGAILAERQGAITNDIAAAEEMKLKASEAEKAYEKSLAEARAEAQRIAEENRREVDAELDEKMAEQDAEISRRQEESEARIAEIREEALQNVERIAKDTAEAIVGQLGGDPESGRVNEAVDRELEARV